jgi:glycosyltransferase involved in cell wall biosynthesis
MRVAFISNISGCSWAGSEELWFGVAMEILGSGHQVAACLHKDLLESEAIGDLINAGGRVLQWSQGRIARFEGLRQKACPNFSLNKLGNPDLVIVSVGALQALSYVPGLADFLMTMDRPFIVLCQFNSDSLHISPRERGVLANLLERSAAQVFVSHQNRDLATRQFAMNFSNSHVIYNPIRKKYDDALPFPDQSGTIVLGCVARLETIWKGQDVLFEILSRPEWRERDWKLRLFGNGPDLVYLQNYARFLFLESRIVFEGYVRDLEEIWSKTHMMVFPSRGEGMPLAILEAMMCGRPVVTTDVGGNSEIIEDGKTGYICESATVKSFGKKLEIAWLDQKHWHAIGNAAHLKAQDIFALNSAKEFLAIIENILKNRK